MYMPTRTNPPFVMNIHNPMRDGVSKKIFKEGCWECKHLMSMMYALSQYPGAFFLDVGGNIGMWSLTAAAGGYQTITIEPFVENYKRICKSVDKNSFHDRVNLLSIAATAAPAMFRLEVPDRNKGGTRVVVVEEDETLGTKDTIHGIPIDSLNLPLDRPVVMKLDVEGHELQVLLGAKNFLQKSYIVYAMMELRPKLHQTPEWKQLFDVLVSKGLEPFRIDDDDATKLDVNNLAQWKHFKHPSVLYYDVIWRKPLFTGIA